MNPMARMMLSPMNLDLANPRAKAKHVNQIHNNQLMKSCNQDSRAIVT